MAEQENLKFWEEQAQKYKDDISAVNFDIQSEELELNQLINLIPNNKKICDFGCGNGRTIFSMIDGGINSNFFGLDMTKGMIEIANQQVKKQQYKNAFFYNLSATSENLATNLNETFDYVISKRLLINIKGKDKYKAIDNIYSVLNKNGTYIMIENFIEPLNKINEIRKEIDLEEIKVHPFNEYLDNTFLDNISSQFHIEKKVDFASFYYLISRIFNANLADKKPDYNSKINQLALLLSKKFDIQLNGYSPEVMYILKKK